MQYKLAAASDIVKKADFLLETSIRFDTIKQFPVMFSL